MKITSHFKVFIFLIFPRMWMCKQVNINTKLLLTPVRFQIIRVLCEAVF